MMHADEGFLSKADKLPLGGFGTNFEKSKKKSRLPQKKERWYLFSPNPENL
jgi:hypothetical protein